MGEDPFWNSALVLLFIKIVFDFFFVVGHLQHVELIVGVRHYFLPVTIVMIILKGHEGSSKQLRLDIFLNLFRLVFGK